MKNIKKIIKDAIIEINKQLPKNKNVSLKENFQILGPSSKFDSMVLINFILIIEEKLKSGKKNLNLLELIMKKMNNNKIYKLSDFVKDLTKNK